MRNLRNVHRALAQSQSGLQLTACTWDVATDEVICTFGPTKNDTLLHLKRWKGDVRSTHSNPSSASSFVSITSWNAPCSLPDLQCDEVLCLHYFPDTFTTSLVLAGGDLIIVREHPGPEEEKIEIVGTVEKGISAAAWSPDEELLAVLSREDTLLYMTRDFENTADTTFTADDLKISRHVSVGWGKAETQFRGRGANALRDPTMPETVDEGILSEYDTKNATISWRGDGEYVAINSIVSDKRRVIRVCSRDGNLESVSEPVDGLTGALSWRPSGNLIASIQRLENRIDVVFFERNGLRHGEYSLRLNEQELSDWGADISLAWNSDSSILAVCFLDRVQLWTMSNYHYYLKQEIFQVDGDAWMSSTPLTWHPEKSLRLAMGTTGGLQKLEYEFVVAIGPTTPPHDYGLVAVIDGKVLKLTPLRLSNIPPPMALWELDSCNNALDVAITTKDGVTMIGILHQNEVTMFEVTLRENPLKTPEKKWVANISANPSWSSAAPRHALNQNISFDRTGEILILQNNVDGSTILALETDGEMQQLTNWPFEEEPELASSEIHMRVDDGLLQSGGPTPKTDFSLFPNGHLFADKRQLAQNCTSFLVTPAHLIFTTSQHLLKFVHMAAVDNLQVPPDTPEVDERCRSVERGARLITVMPSNFALIMQMPRGNLETIYPRALVVAAIRHSINEKKYKMAFFACKNHRVDMNILHDHSPDQFISDVALFIDQVKKVEYLDLFLSQLRDEDVSMTMYKETLRPEQKVDLDDSPVANEEIGKVNRICDAFLNVLQERKSTNLQNVITAHVCKVPPDLEAALNEITRLRQEKNAEQAENATEHICFLTDASRLYEYALSLYDLELALSVAQQTQQDPQEYLPFLQKLEEMPVLRRQHFIADHLGNYVKALHHLYDLKATTIDEVKSYVVEHDLYDQAMKLYRNQPEEYSQILRLNAEYLQKNARYKEAGIAFEYLQEYKLASETYRLAHLWKESLYCATLAGIGHVHVQRLAWTLAEERLDAKDFGSAAVINLDYLSDVEMAVHYYCKGHYYAEAMHLVARHNRQDLLESVDVGLVQGMATMTELLAECKSQLNAQIPRIHELREKKADDPLAFFEGDAGGADVPDNVSIAPTDASTAGASLFTRYTNPTGTVGTNVSRQTSKNKRREERKKARGKKGSVYEEEYLVNSVGRLVERVNGVAEEVTRLVTGLVKRSMRERAMAVENAMAELVELCKDSTAQISQTSSTEHGQQAREAPVVKEFARLSML